MHTVSIARKAQKELRKVAHRDRDAILDAIEALARDPRPDGVVKMKGTREDLYRIRVGDYRVVYHVDDDVLTVLVVRIRHRRDVYR
ncbi:MAG TPA: type II toxin-antitoxin system RelE/ParE family toxin [Rhodothermales bacterium]|nr:type II toxin-antitoxin system RelE/ParE family toxin [Rhodothermales bacterium]